VPIADLTHPLEEGMTTTFTGMVRIPGSIENGLPSTITLDPHVLVLTAGGTELGRWNRSELTLRREPDGSFHLTLGREVVLFNPDSPLEFAILSGMPGAGTAPASAPATPQAAPTASPAAPTEPPMTTPPAPLPVAPVTPVSPPQAPPTTLAPATPEHVAPPVAPPAPTAPPVPTVPPPSAPVAPTAPPIAAAAPLRVSPGTPPPSPSMPPPPATAPLGAPPVVDPMMSPTVPAPSTPIADSPPVTPQAPPDAAPMVPEPVPQSQPMTPRVAPAAGMEPAPYDAVAPLPAVEAPVAFELEQQLPPVEPDPVVAEPEAPRSTDFWDGFYSNENETQRAPSEVLIAPAAADDAPAVPGFHLEDDDPGETGPRAPRSGGYGSGLFTEEDDGRALAPAFAASNADDPEDRTWSFYDEEEPVAERSWSYEDEPTGPAAKAQDEEPLESRPRTTDREVLVGADDGSRLAAVLGAVKGWRPSSPSFSFGSSELGMRAREAVSVLDAILEENGTEDIPRSFILGLGGFAALLALVAVLVVLFG
jgi:hypothetical protein